MYPYFDIICLVHNNLPVTKGFVKHLFENTQNFNLIFVNNGSTDGTYEFLSDGEKSNRWKVINSDTNLGVIGGRNLGAKYVQSDFFMNIDNDQYPQSGWIESLFKLIDKGYDIVGPEAWSLLPPKTPGMYISGNTIIQDRSYFPYKRCTKPADKFTYIGCGGMLLKTSIYRDIGLFDERFNPAYFEDPDFNFRAIQAGYKLGWQQKCNIHHLAHQTFNHQNLFDKNSQFLKSWTEFKKKWLPYFPEPISMEIS